MAAAARLDELAVEGRLETVVLVAGAVQGRRGRLDGRQDRDGDPACPPSSSGPTAASVSRLPTWPTASAIVRKPSSASSSRHSAAMKWKNVSMNSGRPREVLAQLRVLGGDADGTGVEVADAHHDATRDDERRRREAELLGTQKGGDDHVPAGLDLAVDLDDYPVAEPVFEQGLLGLGQPQLPRRSRRA